jgi:hypothetical protein
VDKYLLSSKDYPLPDIDQSATASPGAYEPPSLVVLGTVHELTLSGWNRCFWDKKLGGTDGFTWMGISVPISNCSG